jgi:peptide-methionine (S)-S-oxide reductase
VRTTLPMFMVLFGLAALSFAADAPKKEDRPVSETPKTAVATLANGCFWCTEAVFLELKGVKKVESGYTGGLVPDPSYEQVCQGTTGHAECVQVTYDPSQISFKRLLEVFFKTHDPTTLNRQGNDVGTQYRSGIFYHDEEQKKVAEEVKAALDKSGAFDRPIVTEITKFKTFYKAEEYHQNYWARNPTQGYCRAVIPPKIEKLRKVFAEDLKNP